MMRKKILFVVLAIVCIGAVNANATLIAHWQLNETVNPSVGTTAVDATGNGHNGTYVEIVGGGDGPVVGVTAADPAFGTAAQFSYVSGSLYQGVNVGNFLADYDNDFSVAAWVKPDNFSDLRPILGNENQWRFYTQSGNLYLTTRGVKSYYVSLDGYSADQWMHVAVVMDADNDCSFYVNGSFIGTVTHDAPAKGTDTTSFMIGRISESTGWNNGYNGCIDEVMFFDDSLTANEVAALVVPEPATVVLLGLGVLALRRKRS